MDPTDDGDTDFVCYDTDDGDVVCEFLETFAATCDGIKWQYELCQAIDPDGEPPAQPDEFDDLTSHTADHVPDVLPPVDQAVQVDVTASP